VEAVLVNNPNTKRVNSIRKTMGKYMPSYMVQNAVYVNWYGKHFKGKFLKDIQLLTSMEIKRIIGSIILNWKDYNIFLVLLIITYLNSSTDERLSKEFRKGTETLYFSRLLPLGA
jgi:hypothetical protein